MYALLGLMMCILVEQLLHLAPVVRYHWCALFATNPSDRSQILAAATVAAVDLWSCLSRSTWTDACGVGAVHDLKSTAMMKMISTMRRRIVINKSLHLPVPDAAESSREIMVSMGRQRQQLESHMIEASKVLICIAAYRRDIEND